MCFSCALFIIRDLLSLKTRLLSVHSSSSILVLRGQIRKVQKTARVHGKDRVRGHYLPVWQKFCTPTTIVWSRTALESPCPPNPHLYVKVQKSVIMPELSRWCFKLLLLCLFLKNIHGFTVIKQNFKIEMRTSLNSIYMTCIPYTFHD